MPKLEKFGISPRGREFEDASVTLGLCVPAGSGLPKGLRLPHRITFLETSSFIVPPHGPALI